MSEVPAAVPISLLSWRDWRTSSGMDRSTSAVMTPARAPAMRDAMPALASTHRMPRRANGRRRPASESPKWSRPHAGARAANVLATASLGAWRKQGSEVPDWVGDDSVASPERCALLGATRADNCRSCGSHNPNVPRPGTRITPASSSTQGSEIHHCDIAPRNFTQPTLPSSRGGCAMAVGLASCTRCRSPHARLLAD